jgi:hypothetical protein
MTAAATWRPKLERIGLRKHHSLLFGSRRIIIMIIVVLMIRVIPWMAYAMLAVAVKVDV